MNSKKKYENWILFNKKNDRQLKEVQSDHRIFLYHKLDETGQKQDKIGLFNRGKW